MSDLFVKRDYRTSVDIDDFSFFDGNQIGDKINSTDSDATFLGKYLSDKKINYFLLFMVLGLSLLLAKSLYLQVAKGDYYKAVADTNRTREKPLLSDRGLIYDSQKRQLVINIPFFDAKIIPKELSLDEAERQQQIFNISLILGTNKDDIVLALNKYPKNFKYQITVKEDIEYEQALILMIEAKDIPGLYIQSRSERKYLYPYEFSHILGYEGKITETEFATKSNEGYLLGDYLGKTGLESGYESVLRGKYGKEGVEVDVSGHEKKVLYHEDQVNGKNLVLTIDQNVQTKIREVVSNYLRKINKTRASVVMINPQNGAILGLLSMPDFDNNLFAGGISSDDYKNLIENSDNPLFDRAIKGEYPSGSSIKPAVAAGALQEGLITDRTSFMSSGGLWLYDRWFFPDWAAGGHGATNVYRAIAWSVNTFFYIVGGGYNDFVGLGPEGLEKYFRLFGLGEKTGIDLPGESKGLVPTPLWKLKQKNEQWFIGDTYHIAIGQGDLLATPLQIANYTASIANGGKLYKPYLVQEMYLNPEEKEITEPKIIRENFISQENLNIVRQAMRQTVTLGSAQYLQNVGVSVAGKTGTAQWNTTKNNHAWFTGFAPYDNPEIAITVLVEEGGEGSAVSVPITNEILTWYFNVYKK